MTEEKQSAIPAQEPASLPLSTIQPSTTNPRKTFKTQGLEELAKSIEKYGVMQPIVVRRVSEANDPKPSYEIIAGERRFRASKMAGLSEIPARIIDVSDLDVILELQVIENLQREDLHPLEEAESYESLLQAHKNDPGYGVDEVAAKLGKSRAYVYARMKLCALQPAARQAFYDGKLTASTALLLARIPVVELQDKALGEITRPNWNDEIMSYRAAAAHIQQHYMTRLDQAGFKVADATLLPEAGPCTTCPKRTGANPDLFDDVGRADVCTDPVCFSAKKAAHVDRLKAAAQEAGTKVITGKQAKKILPSRWESPKGYVKPDDSPWWLDGTKSIKKVLGKQTPEAVLVENPHTGELITLLPEDRVREALKEAGHKVSRCGSESSANARAEDAKLKAERAYRRELLQRTHDAVLETVRGMRSLSIEDLRAIAAHTYSNLGADNRPTVRALWGWPGDKNSWEPPEQLNQASYEDLVVMLLDAALARDSYASIYTYKKKPELLLATAQRYGVDAAQVKKEVAAQAKKKAIAVKAPAKAPAKSPAKAAAKTAPKVKRSKVVPAVRYRHPDTGETWTGRGKAPRWITVAEAEGQARDAFLIGKAGDDQAKQTQEVPDVQAA